MRSKHDAYIYRMTFNAMHGGEYNTHPHTFLATIYLGTVDGRNDRDLGELVGNVLDRYFGKYEGQVVGDLKWFAGREDTIENMTELFYLHLTQIFEGMGVILYQVELGDSPLKSYGVGSRMVYGSTYEMADEEQIRDYMNRLKDRYDGYWFDGLDENEMRRHH